MDIKTCLIWLLKTCVFDNNLAKKEPDKLIKVYFLHSIYFSRDKKSTLFFFFLLTSMNTPPPLPPQEVHGSDVLFLFSKIL